MWNLSATKDEEIFETNKNRKKRTSNLNNLLKTMITNFRDGVQSAELTIVDSR